jgi:hypothetical protein
MAVDGSDGYEKHNNKKNDERNIPQLKPQILVIPYSIHHPIYGFSHPCHVCENISTSRDVFHWLPVEVSIDALPGWETPLLAPTGCPFNQK